MMNTQTRSTKTKVDREIKGYKRSKLAILHQLGFRVGKEIFEKATTEIQVDNIARSIILR